MALKVMPMPLLVRKCVLSKCMILSGTHSLQYNHATGIWDRAVPTRDACEARIDTNGDPGGWQDVVVDQ